MDKDTILNYVTETPGNTNRAVLGSMLDSLDSGSENHAELIETYVGIGIDAGDYGAYWDDNESKRFADIVQEIEEGNIVIIIGIYMYSIWAIFKFKEKTDSLLTFESDSNFRLTINQNNYMELTQIT